MSTTIRDVFKHADDTRKMINRLKARCARGSTPAKGGASFIFSQINKLDRLTATLPSQERLTLSSLIADVGKGLKTYLDAVEAIPPGKDDGGAQARCDAAVCALIPHVKAGGDTKTKKAGRPKGGSELGLPAWFAKAATYAKENDTTSPTRIAKAAGVAASTVTRNKVFKKFLEEQRKEKTGTVRHGHVKTKDNVATLEADAASESAPPAHHRQLKSAVCIECGDRIGIQPWDEPEQARCDRCRE